MPDQTLWLSTEPQPPLYESELTRIFTRAGQLRSVRSPERDTLLKSVGLALWYHVDDHYVEGWWYRWDNRRVGSFPTITAALEDALTHAPNLLRERAVGQ